MKLIEIFIEIDENDNYITGALTFASQHSGCHRRMRRIL
jgi:hypothetical protein